MPYEAKTNWKYDDTVTEKDLNRIEQGLKDAHVAEYKDITLKPGVQIVDVPEDTPFRMGEIRGRTLINLLGYAGACENTSLWKTNSVTAEKFTSEKVQGESSLKVTLGNIYEAGNAFRFIENTTSGKSYVLMGYIKNSSGSGTVRIEALEYNGDKSLHFHMTRDVDSGDKFHPVHMAFTLSDQATRFAVHLAVLGKMNESYGLFDAIRVYEIPTSEVEKINAMTSEQVAAAYPYVDAMTNVKNPYAISTSGNLLPLLYGYDSASLNGAQADLQGVYKGRVVTEKTAQFLGWANISVKPNSTYSIRAEKASAIAKMYVNEQPSVGIPHTKQHTFDPIQGGTFTTKSDTNVIGVYFGNHDTVGEISFENPVLSPTAMPQPFAPQSRSMWVADCQLAANPVDGSDADVLKVGDEGLPYVLEKWSKVALDGSLPWEVVVEARKSGFKILFAANAAPNNATPGDWDDAGKIFSFKYDGKLLSVDDSGVVDWESSDLVRLFTSNVYVSVSNTDSGWGDSYTPTVDEIKAYFLGWRMGSPNDWSKPYNGSGEKAWGRIDGKGALISGTGTTTTPTELNTQGGYTPYRLQYLKARPTVEPVSNYETGLMLSKGWNMVELGSGVVLREKADFAINAANTHYCVNTTEGSGDAPTPFRYRTEDILSIFKNQKTYAHWEKNIFLPYGKYRATIVKEYYDPTAVYHVSYTILDPTLAAPINGSISTNLRSAVTDVVQWAGDAERRLSVVETKKAENDTKLHFIKPTLLNDWKLFGESGRPEAGYCKDRDGFVYLKGVITGGTVGVTGKPAFFLPVGYRPKRLLSKIAITTLSSNAAVDIAADGGVYIITGDNYFIALDTISPFLAEQ
ncbi:hypothetical protein [Paenibacillus sp. NAIST15-1]|uniref:hypothetical protein n=1 Tax=Paenibacillus sp. NAIST15-1 TaxID=1605994 RepID=UPI0008694BCF|nr:hypothetical protein [Paenibacillus sp. NAIST15-1]GAV10115.1 hypothetical protein PBN151_0018 [Paenibacillus sp. NAIST15-1]